MRRKTGRSDSSGMQAYRKALEELDGTVTVLLDLACGVPASDIDKCREVYRYARNKCAKLQAEREGFLAQREEDRRELRLLRSKKADLPVTGEDQEISTRMDGGSEVSLPPIPVVLVETEELRVIHSHISRMEDLVERLCSAVESLLSGTRVER